MKRLITLTLLFAFGISSVTIYASDVDNYGRNTLHLAVINHDLEKVRSILKEKANLLHETNNDGYTPLMEAAQYPNNEQMIQLLLDYETDASGKIWNVEKALVVAKQRDYSSNIKLLKKYQGSWSQRVQRNIDKAWGLVLVSMYFSSHGLPRKT